jgi:hypothetical protein
VAIPEWLVQTCLVTAISIIGWFLRGLWTDVSEIKLDLAKNYVTHAHLRSLRRDQRRTVMLLNHIQLQLAQHVPGFEPMTISSGDDGLES